MIKIDWISGKGRGIVATQPIEKGRLIEAAPVCQFPPRQRKLIDETALSVYCFVKPSEYSSNKKQASGYIVFGLSSFCNHSEKPNSTVEWVENSIGLWVNLIALQDIHSGEEITMFYTNIDEYTFSSKRKNTQRS